MKYNFIYKLFNYLFLIVISSFTGLTYSQVQGNEPVMQTKVYKTIRSTKLKLYIFQPSVRKDLEKLPAIVFFHGGAWAGGNAWQFIPQSKYLAERGMVAISAEYRVRKRQGATPFECVADAKSAIRYVRAHASDYGIDEKRIAAGGGSAGGHMAACAALIKGFDEKNEDLSISSVPNALVLFNPVLDVPEIVDKLPKKVIKVLEGRETEISPIHHLSEGAPPTIIFHGTADEAVPFHQATRFCETMKKYDNNCEVVPFEGLRHGFFNYYKGENPSFFSTMEKTDRFLISIRYLKGQPVIK
jgi:acetyl esterase/lipase